MRRAFVVALGAWEGMVAAVVFGACNEHDDVKKRSLVGGRADRDDARMPENMA